ncbi:MAG: (2Fe-2S) ferredoxin domain-containing protein [Clostridiales bacterium]|jgi:NADP-reducing hydrogenase subunit HndB|nr:(2Fe-2S) ferredoxin domain-containing protein [Clostridiales bacterium]
MAGKSLADLKAIKERAKQQVELRREHAGYKIVVGMATCGIAAGAQPVMGRLVERVAVDGIENVTVTQTGCIGVCRLEPIVEVFDPAGEKTTYVKMTSEKADKIIDFHIKGGKPLMEYTIGYEENK